MEKIMQIRSVTFGHSDYMQTRLALALGESLQLPEKLIPGLKQPTVIEGFVQMSDIMKEQIKKKFELAYFVAKKELPFTMYEDLVTLEKHHGVDIGNAYVNRIECADFIDYHGEYLSKTLTNDLKEAKFYSVLTDGTTDCSVTEKELVYVLYFNPKQTGENIGVKLAFLCLKDVKKADAPGIKSVIESSFASLGITNNELYSKLVGFGADGASVNSGDKNGVKALLQEKSPWLIFQWCVAHRLELALKDALQPTFFKQVDQMLTRLHSFYSKSPKKLHELKSLHELLKNTFDFVEGSLKPKRASGTRWISFKLAALRLVLSHLENLAEQEGNAEIVGYLRRWKTSQMLLHIAFFIDVLTPAAELSKIYQEGDIDIVSATSALNRTKHKLELYSNLRLQDLPATKYLLSKVDKQGGTHTYQGIEFSSIQFERELELLKAKKNIITEAVCACISTRLDDSGSPTLQDIAVVLNIESWMARASLPQEDESDDGNDSNKENSSHKFNEGSFDVEIIRLFEHFQPVLAKQAQLQENVEVCFSVILCKIKMEEHPYLTLVELLFSIPVSNAKLERMFSNMQRAKVDSRCSLGEQRLTHLLRIKEEGPELGTFDVTPVVELWLNSKVRRPNQNKRKKYKQRKQKSKKYYDNDNYTNLFSLIDNTDSSSTEESDDVIDVSVEDMD
ncbi:zinc finger 862-like [Paramuricea clavata]|uniref:Zinc finger 862-like n=1 Tax=Paramuricea clavata TaxID=317549 RepID=A0A6S7HJW7_PARCT|nr:zinc finger 862-like [Paramuricea clavata]